jgi:hypothetical protein
MCRIAGHDPDETEGLHEGSAHEVADKLDSDKRPSAREGERKEKKTDEPNHRVN